MSRLKCCDCGKVFEPDDIMVVREYRGECHGFPAYESVALSPCCGEDFEEVECDENGIVPEVTLYELDKTGEYEIEVTYYSDWYYEKCLGKCDTCKFYKNKECLWEV